VSRRRALAAGAFVVAAFAIGSIASAHLDPFYARPVLDGLGPPPPYRWVSPPPALAPTNQQPFAGTFTVRIAGAGGSRAAILSTKDYQVSLVLGAGAFPAHGQDTAVSVEVMPVAPDTSAQLPDDEQIAGNVYRITASYEPSGSHIEAVGAKAELVLIYPRLSPSASDSTTLFSLDGRTWRAVRSTDHAGQQSVQSALTVLGSYAVGQTQGPIPVAGPSRGPSPDLFLVVAAVAIAALATFLGAIRARMSTRRGRRP